MAIYQYRYFGEESSLNNITKTKLVEEGLSGNIKKLGIQAPPGTRVYLNGSNTYIQIGEVGIYEIDLSVTNTNINQLRFYLDDIEKIDTNKSSYLIIDILDEGGTAS